MAPVADVCLWESAVDAQGRRWYTCSQAPTPRRQLCAYHVGIANQRKRVRAKSKAAKRARKASR